MPGDDVDKSLTSPGDLTPPILDAAERPVDPVRAHPLPSLGMIPLAETMAGFQNYADANRLLSEVEPTD